MTHTRDLTKNTLYNVPAKVMCPKFHDNFFPLLEIVAVGHIQIIRDTSAENDIYPKNTRKVVISTLNLTKNLLKDYTETIRDTTLLTSKHVNCKWDLSHTFYKPSCRACMNKTKLQENGPFEGFEYRSIENHKFTSIHFVPGTITKPSETYKNVSPDFRDFPQTSAQNNWVSHKTRTVDRVFEIMVTVPSFAAQTTGTKNLDTHCYSKAWNTPVLCNLSEARIVASQWSAREVGYRKLMEGENVRKQAFPTETWEKPIWTPKNFKQRTNQATTILLRPLTPIARHQGEELGRKNDSRRKRHQRH